jgi:hypothetical protein
MNKRSFKSENQASLKRNAIICGLLMVAILVLYWRVINYEFVNYDDDLYITENLYVQKGVTWEGTKWAFSFNNVVYFHPLSWLSHMLDVQLFGMAPGLHHLTSVLFHIANTILLYLFFNRMTGAAWRSALVAMLFAVHPINVESVAWVAERKSVLSAFFWMLTMYSYIRYVEQPGVLRYLWILIFFSLGLMGKPMLVTLPFVLLLLDFWPLDRINLQTHRNTDQGKANAGILAIFQTNIRNRFILEKIPLFAVSLVAIFISSIAVERLGITLSYESKPISLRLSNAVVSYFKYLAKIFWPSDLTFLYPYPRTLPTLQIIGSALILICITTGVLMKLRKAPFLGVGWFWYLGTLIPVTGLIQAGFWPAMADRFAYLPTIGIFIIVVWGISGLVKNWRFEKKLLSAAAVVTTIMLMTATWVQLGFWRNSNVLFKHALEVTENNYLVHNNLGNIYFRQGELDKAIHHYSESLRINPSFALAHNNLGAAMLRSGKIEEAIFHFRQAIILEPGNIDAQRNLKKLLKFKDLKLKAQQQQKL